MIRRFRLLLAPFLVAALVGCGADQGRTALAVEHTRWSPDGTLVVQTECSEELEAHGATVARQPTIYEVTIWGKPRVGRCHPEMRLSVGTRVTKLRDAAGNQLVELPPRP